MADAIPIPDQTAPHNCSRTYQVFSTYGPPQIDQGHNFESAIFTQVLHAFGVRKS